MFDFLVGLGTNLFLRLVTLDGVFGAVCFLSTIFMGGKLNEGKILERSNIYGVGTVGRYVNYWLIFIFYKVFTFSFWMERSVYVELVMLVFAVPFVFNRVIRTRVYGFVEDYKKYLFRIVVSRVLAMFVNGISRNYLDFGVKVKYHDIMVNVGDFDVVWSNLMETFRNLFVLFLLDNVKNNYSSRYYSIAKAIYGFKTGDLLVSFNVNDSKSYVVQVVRNRRWGELLKANFYKAVQCVILNSEGRMGMMMLERFNYLLLKFFSVWTLTEVFGRGEIAPVVSLYLLYYEFEDFGWRLGVDVLILGMVLGYVYVFGGGYFLVSFCSQFGGEVVSSGVVYKIVKGVNKYLFRHNDRLFYFVFANVVYVSVVRYYGLNVCSFVNVGFNLMVGENVRENLVLLGVLLLSVRSGGNVFHLVFNSGLFYLLSVLKFEVVGRKYGVLVKDKISVVENYLG